MGGLSPMGMGPPNPMNDPWGQPPMQDNTVSDCMCLLVCVCEHICRMWLLIYKYVAEKLSSVM